MAKRRIVPLFDLLSKPQPEEQNGTQGQGAQTGLQPGSQNGNATSNSIGAYGLRVPSNKPIVRLNLGPSSKAGTPSAAARAVPTRQDATSGRAGNHTSVSLHAPTSEASVASAAPELSRTAADEFASDLRDSLRVDPPSSKSNTRTESVDDANLSIFQSSSAPLVDVEAKPSHKFVGSSSTISPIHGETLTPPPEYDAAKARASTAIAKQAAALSADVDAESSTSSLIHPRIISLAIFALIVIVVGTWAIAFKFGVVSGKERTEGFVRRDPPIVHEPTNSGGDATTGMSNIGSATPTTLSGGSGSPANAGAPVVQSSSTRQQQPVQNPTKSSAQPQTQAAKPQSIIPPAIAVPNAKGILMPQGLDTRRYELLPHNPNDFLTVRGWEVTDLRVVGLNYLMVATLSTQDAGEAVEFLAANGLEAFAVPILEKARKGTKDKAPQSGQPSKYRVFVGPGMTGDEVRADRDQPLKTKIADLGEFWSKEAKKPTDFRQPYLIKHVPE